MQFRGLISYLMKAVSLFTLYHIPFKLRNTSAYPNSL